MVVVTPPWETIVADGLRAGQHLGAVGPGPVEQQIALARSLVPLLEDADRGVDLGTGAGLPGLILAGERPHMAWRLVDAAQRRVRLVDELLATLGWGDRVTVTHGRAEDLGRTTGWREWADVVVARSFGPPAVTAECAAPLCRAGGRVLVTEPPSPGPDRWPAEGLAALGLEDAGVVGEPAVRILTRAHPLPDGVPRRAGMPTKRPRW